MPRQTVSSTEIENTLSEEQLVTLLDTARLSLMIKQAIPLTVRVLANPVELPVRAIWKIEVRGEKLIASLQKVKVDVDRLTALFGTVREQMSAKSTFNIANFARLLLTITALKEHDLVFVYDRFISSTDEKALHKEVHNLLGWEAQDTYLSKLTNYIGAYPHRFHEDALEAATILASMKEFT